MLAGTLLLAEVAIAGRGVSVAGHCGRDRGMLQYIGTLPKNTIIAGDPTAIGCVTIVSERPVVISRKLYQVFSSKYLSVARPRMFAMIDAYFGDSRSEDTRAASALRRRLPGRAARVTGRSHGTARLAAHGTIHRYRQSANALHPWPRGPPTPGSLPHLRRRSQRGLRPALRRGRLDWSLSKISRQFVSV